MPRGVVLIGIVVTLLLIITASGCISPTPTRATQEYHIHVDFAVIVNGEKMDFAQEKYMSEKAPGQILAKYVHLHDGKGNVIHFHAPRVTLREFFESIGMGFDENCFTDDRNAMYCKDGFVGGNASGSFCFVNDANEHICTLSDEQKTLKFYVNGVANQGFGDYVPKDLDRVLITYGNESGITLQQQIHSVSDEACIQSLKCPERGPPAPEDGCDATDTCVFDFESVQ